MPDERKRAKFGPFSTWQWAVIGAYLIAIVLSAYVGMLARRADENAHNGNVAICVEARFLRNTADTTRAYLRANPKDPFTRERRQSLSNLEHLIHSLEEAIPSCREALK
jgi:hypothetical protein